MILLVQLLCVCVSIFPAKKFNRVPRSLLCFMYVLLKCYVKNTHWYCMYICTYMCLCTCIIFYSPLERSEGVVDVGEEDPEVVFRNKLESSRIVENPTQPPKHFGESKALNRCHISCFLSLCYLCTHTCTCTYTYVYMHIAIVIFCVSFIIIIMTLFAKPTHLVPLCYIR